MPRLDQEQPPTGQEVIFRRIADSVLFPGIHQEDGTWTMSLPDADTTFDPATCDEWYLAV